MPGKSHGQRSLEGYSPWDHKTVGHDTGTKQQQPHRRGGVGHRYRGKVTWRNGKNALWRLATSQGTSGATRSQKGRRRTLPYEGAWLCPYLDFGLRTETLNCCSSEPPTLWYLERAAAGNTPPAPDSCCEVGGEGRGPQNMPPKRCKEIRRNARCAGRPSPSLGP